MAVKYDPLGPEFRADREGVYRRLRDEAPVYFDADGRYAALSRFEDVRNAAMDWKRYSAVTAEAKILRPIINDMDPPLHTDRRKNLSRAFTPRRVAEMEPRLRQIARSLIDAFAERGSCDLVAEFAALYPSMVMGQLIGIPDELLAECRHITDAVMRIEGPEGNASPVERADVVFSALVEERRRAPSDDLISALLAVGADGGEPLGDDEILGFCYLLLVGGNDTTTNLIGNGMDLLARHPQQRASLVADPGRIPGAVEEMLRREPPTQTSARQSTADLTLHGDGDSGRHARAPDVGSRQPRRARIRGAAHLRHRPQSRTPPVSGSGCSLLHGLGARAAGGPGCLRGTPGVHARIRGDRSRRSGSARRGLGASSL